MCIIGSESEEENEKEGLPFFIQDDTYLLDFGHENELGVPVSRMIRVCNTSAIPTSLEAFVSWFVAADIPSQGQYIQLVP